MPAASEGDGGSLMVEEEKASEVQDEDLKVESPGEKNA